MSDYEHSVFISYAWGGEREEIVNQLDHALQARGINIIRDKRDLGYKGSIGEFMERIGRGNCIIIVISDKYLRSKNCMFELVEIAENRQFADRIFPIILPDAKIYDPVERLDYVEFWEKEKAKLNEKIRSLTDLSNLQGIREELDNYDRFRDRISGLTSTLKDMNTLTPDLHRESAFHELYAAIEKRIKQSQGTIATALEETFELEYFEPETIQIPGGPFWMGSTPGPGVQEYETPLHEVNLPTFRIGKYPVTNREYEEYIHQTENKVSREMNWNGKNVPIGEELLPVIGVTWNEAVNYCNWLSDRTGRVYRLPSEAQFEKACRGGKNCLFPWGDDFDPDRCNHGRSNRSPVDKYLPQNDYGGYDFVGNIRQWTCTLWGARLDAPDPKYAYPWKDDGRNELAASPLIRRVVRGSSMRDEVGMLRCSTRRGEVPKEPGLPGTRHSFRVVLIV